MFDQIYDKHTSFNRLVNNLNGNKKEVICGIVFMFTMQHAIPSIVPSQLFGSFVRHGRRRGYRCLDTRRRSKLCRPPS